MNQKGKFYLPATIIMFALGFLFCWFNDFLFDRFFILPLIPMFTLIITYFVLVIYGIVVIVKGQIKRGLAGLVVLGLLFLKISVFPFKTAKRQVDQELIAREREKVVEMIVSGEIPSKDPLVTLPLKYTYLSSDGTVYVYQNDENGVEVSFWEFRGMLSGSDEIIYASGGEQMIWDNESEHPIRIVRPLGGNWFYVATDY